MRVGSSPDRNENAVATGGLKGLVSYAEFSDSLLLSEKGAVTLNQLLGTDNVVLFTLLSD